MANLCADLIVLDGFYPKRIAVVGDAMTDVYVHGHLAPSQDGCRKFVEESRVECYGGAANAAQCLSRWDSQVNFFGQSATLLPRKTRYVESGVIVFRHDDDRLRVVDTQRQRELSTMWEYSPAAVLISDYDKGYLSEKDISEIVFRANSRKIPVVADAKRPPDVYRGAVLKCNLEYSQKYSLAGRPGTIITCGASNPAQPSTSMPFMDDGQTAGCWQIGRLLQQITCVNHVGAGDCFAAHLALALAHGFSIRDAAAVAHSAGRVYVQHPHNRAPHPEEISRDLELT